MGTSRRYFTLINGWPHFETEFSQHMQRFDAIVRKARRFNSVKVSRYRTATTSKLLAVLPNRTTVSVNGYWE